MSDLERIRMISSWTLPYVEVLEIVGKDKVKRGRLPEIRTAIDTPSFIAELARVKADNQYHTGRQNGFYPEGFLVEGGYEYAASLQELRQSHPNEKVKSRNYDPKLITDIDLAVAGLFPDSVRTKDYFRDVTPISRSPLASEDVLEHSGRFFFEAFSGHEPKKKERVNLVGVHGLPVFICSSVQDFADLKPYAFINLPENTQAYSYTITRYSRPFKGRKLFGNFPIVVAMEGTPHAHLSQLMLSQIEAARFSKPEDSTVVLASSYKEGKRGRSVGRIDRWLDQQLKTYLLMEIIRLQKPLDWVRLEKTEDRGGSKLVPTVEASRIINSMKKLLVQSASPLFVGDQIGVLKMQGDQAWGSVIEMAESKVWEAMKIVDALGKDVPSIEYQLVAANYLSFFPLARWQEAQANLSRYEIDTNFRFRNSFGIPIPRRRNGSGGTRE